MNNNDPFLSNPSGYDMYNQKKDSKNSKLSIESKITFKQTPTAKFGVNLHREYSLGAVQMPSNMAGTSSKRKNIGKQLMASVSELKKLKSYFT